MKLTRTKKILAAAFVTLAAGTTAAAVIGFRPTSHAAEPASLGSPSATDQLVAVLDTPTDLTVETVTGADWEVDRSGVLDLHDPQAKKAGLEDGPEPIQIFFHAIHHPRRGLFLVDTGVERALFDDPDHAAIRGLVKLGMHADKMKRGTDTATWLATQHEPVRGVFLTHLHLDHVSGMRDVPRDAPIFAGPGETTERGLLNALVASSTDRALEGHGPIQEWKFERDPSGVFTGVLDVFGDQTVWALWVPGHTAGSTAYLVRTSSGPVLLVGDACHTAWGWEHGVAPGSFSAHPDAGVKSLAALRGFVAAHPSISVRLGHQHLAATSEHPQVSTATSR
jgi:N-acyl homoserine lactone hydrolase